MSSMRSAASRFLRSMSRCLSAVVLAAVLMTVAGLHVEAARADDRPFWDKAEPAKAKRKKLGGYAAKTEPRKYKKGVKVAALNPGYYGGSAPKKSLSGGGVRWAANAGCLDSGLKAVIYQVAANFGPVTVSSTCRSKARNAAVGGAHKSKHLSGDAADFRVHGNIRGVYAFLRSTGGVGGLKHYGGGLFHIDNGERRTW